MQVATLRAKYRALQSTFTERSRRLWAATEAQAIGYGGIALVARVTGLAESTIQRGLRDVRTRECLPPARSRRVGGGRKRVTVVDRTLLRDLEALVEPTARGDPESPLRWTTKSVRILAVALQAFGHQVSHTVVGELLHALGYSLQDQADVACQMRKEIDSLNIESDGQGWQAKAFLYCVEARCPQTGWMVPMLPTRVVSAGYRVITDLVPDVLNRRYEIVVRRAASDDELRAAESGTIGRDGKYGEAYLTHNVDGATYRTKISTLRGDYEKSDGTVANRLRLWERRDFMPRPEDILQERLYCVQWSRPKRRGKGEEYEFRSVSPEDLEREDCVSRYVSNHLSDWQEQGVVPDMRIEIGGPPRYQGLDLGPVRKQVLGVAVSLGESCSSSRRESDGVGGVASPSAYR